MKVISYCNQYVDVPVNCHEWRDKNYYQANKWQEQRKISIWGSLVDPIPNSPNLYYKNCMADGKGSKENYKWDLGSERVNQIKFQNPELN